MTDSSSNSVIRQCLSLLPTENLACPLLNYDSKKLSIEALVKLFVTAQIERWDSYSEFDIKMRAHEDLMDYLGVKSISSSQLSRRINELDTTILQELFFKVVKLLESYKRQSVGITEKIGKLSIVDSTHIKLPPVLSEWAHVTKGWTVVKMHTRLLVISKDIHYPDRIVPSNGKVQDHEGGDILIEASDTTYVMDRGYMDLYRMHEWIKNGLKFVVRIKEGLYYRLLEDYVLPENSRILKDAKVVLSKNEGMEPVRLVEFLDEQGYKYRIATTRWDLTAEEIAEIYKNRWIIELFFKWIKQSLRFIKVWSRQPQGIWNQMYIAMIAYILTLIVKLKTNSNKTMRNILIHLKTYLYRPWEQFLSALEYKPEKISKGRQKVPGKPKKMLVKGSVALWNDGVRKRSRRKFT